MELDKQAEQRFLVLDGLRGVVAMLVAAFHLQQRMHYPSMPGYLAVDLFYVLSGFVIARSYTARLGQGMTLAEFSIRRLIRLYPLYLIGFGIGLMLPILFPYGTDGIENPEEALFGAIALGAFMVPTPFGTALYPLNGAAWSLFFELMVNILFAALLWKLANRAIWMIALLCTAALVGLVHWPIYFNMGWSWADFDGGTVRALGGFAAGILLHRHLPIRPRYPSWWAWLPLAIVCLPLMIDSLPVDRTVWEICWVVIGFPAIVALGTQMEPPIALRSIFRQLGAISFPLYAIHWPLAAIMRPMLQNLSPLVATAAFLLIALACAHVAAKWLEPPIARFMHRLWRRSNPIGRPPVPVA